mgnify:CR=1 FL=1
MIHFLIGLFFIFIDFHVKVNFIPGTLEILPSFIGYFFILRGIYFFKAKHNSFEDIKVLTLALGFYSLVIFILDIVGLDYGLGAPVVKIANSIVFKQLLPLFLVYKIVWGIIDIAYKEKVTINEDGLKMVFIYIILVSSLTLFLSEPTILMIVKIAQTGLSMVLLYYLYDACQAHKSTQS